MAGGGDLLEYIKVLPSPNLSSLGGTGVYTKGVLLI